MKRSLAAWASALVVAGGVAAAAPQIVADLGSRQLTVADVRAELRDLRATGDVAMLLKTMDEKGRATVVREMVVREQFALAARAAGVEKQPEIAAEIDRAVTKILGAHYEAVERQKADTSEPRLREYYEAHRADFQARPRVRARHILTKTREEADSVRADLLAGADFAQLAVTRSADPYTRDKGGELGWISEGVMVEAFEDAVFALKAGEISAVVESSHGFHIIRVDTVEPAAPRSFDSVRALVVERVQQVHLDRVRLELDSKFPVKLFPEALKALER
jgi:peptidyl-prolyl cis-trans isomerase C